MNPKFIGVKVVFNFKGGVHINVECRHRKKGSTPIEVISLCL